MKVRREEDARRSATILGGSETTKPLAPGAKLGTSDESAYPKDAPGTSTEMSNFALPVGQESVKVSPLREEMTPRTAHCQPWLTAMDKTFVPSASHLAKSKAASFDVALIKGLVPPRSEKLVRKIYDYVNAGVKYMRES